MSWAEIKKAINSNLALPLNTLFSNLISKATDPNTYQIAGLSQFVAAEDTSVWFTVVDISGEGKLNGIYIQVGTKVEDDTSLKITIDGATYQYDCSLADRGRNFVSSKSAVFFPMTNFETNMKVEFRSTSVQHVYISIDYGLR